VRRIRRPGAPDYDYSQDPNDLAHDLDADDDIDHDDTDDDHNDHEPDHDHADDDEHACNHHADSGYNLYGHQRRCRPPGSGDRGRR